MLTSLKSKKNKKTPVETYVTYYCAYCNLKFTYAVDTNKSEIVCPICKKKMSRRFPTN
jgi:rubrerythrin